MPGLPVTSGFAQKRGSLVASGMTNCLLSMIAWAQKATSRPVPPMPSRPTFAANRCSASPTSEISAIGVFAILEATFASPSSAWSGASSSIPRLSSNSRRSTSFSGFGYEAVSMAVTFGHDATPFCYRQLS